MQERAKLGPLALFKYDLTSSDVWEDLRKFLNYHCMCPAYVYYACIMLAHASMLDKSHVILLLAPLCTLIYLNRVAIKENFLNRRAIKHTSSLKICAIKGILRGMHKGLLSD